MKNKLYLLMLLASQVFNFGWLTAQNTDIPTSSQVFRVVILPDTQGAINENGIPRVELAHLMPEVMKYNPMMVLHVGDVTDGVDRIEGDGSNKRDELIEFNTIVTSPLAAQGILFYPVIGNHDAPVSYLEVNGRQVWEEGFPYLFGGTTPLINPADVPGGSIQTPNDKNFSYVLSTPDKSSYFVMVSHFNGNNYVKWVEERYAAIRAESPDAHIFTIMHQNLFSLGGHSRTDDADSMLYITKQYHADGWLTGHSHSFHRSMAVDTQENAYAFHMVTGSASNKNYDFGYPPSSNQRIQRAILTSAIPSISFQVMDINGTFVSIKTYMADKVEVATYGDWYLVDEYVYSTNGKQFVVNSLQDYENASVSDTSFNGTQAHLVQGSNESTLTFESDGTQQFYRNVTTGWLSPAQWYQNTNATPISDILVLRGLSAVAGKKSTSIYTLKMSYDDANMTLDQEKALALISFSDLYEKDEKAGLWYNAAQCNQNPFAAAEEAVFRAPLSTDKDGVWGVNTEENYVWARLDYEGNFAVGNTVDIKPRKYELTEEIIPVGSIWKYKTDSLEEDIETWMTNDFIDTDWISGATGIGYGDGDDATIIDNTARVFARKSFVVEDSSEVTDLELKLDYDDGCAVFLNGVLIYTDNAPKIINDSSVATGLREAGETITIDMSSAIRYLRNGTNILAAVGLNESATSSDLSLIPSLKITILQDKDNIEFYSITASSGILGAISSAGETTIGQGASKTYIFTPDNGYEVLSVSVDGRPVGSIASYTFDNITSDHTIHATFGVLDMEEKIISEGDVWKYRIKTVDNVDAWNTVNYDDSDPLWLTGTTSMGYGSNGDYTVATGIVGGMERCFMRKMFTVEDALQVASMKFTVDYDDGYAAYINGILVCSSNAPAVIDNSSKATTAGRNAGTVEEVDITSIALPVLVSGDNVLAIVVLNASISSSDLFMLPELSIVTGSSTPLALEEFTNLPSLYPNPSTGNITLNNLLAGTAVFVYDINGRLIRKQYVLENSMQINNLPRGILLIKSATSTGMIVQKVIVQ